MKFRTTNKQIKNNYGYIVRVGYCDLQDLLTGVDPFAYTCGVYGWNFDVYEVNGTTICTGYRGMVGRSVNYERLKEYEAKAEKIIYDNSLDYCEQKSKVECLLDEFIRAEFADWFRR